MDIRRFYFLPVFVALPLAVSFNVIAAQKTVVKEQSNYTASLDIEYSTGDYGTGITTDCVTTKHTLDWYPTNRLDFSMEIPYLYQSSSAAIPVGNGRIRSFGMQQAGPFTARGLKLRLRHRWGSSHVASTIAPTRSQSGIGDLVLKGGYIILDENGWAPEIRPEAYVKFPTADEKKGLGTGEFDGGIGMTLNKWINDLNLYFEGVYNFTGKSPDFRLQDYFSYEFGLGYQVTDRLLPTIVLKGTTKPAEDSDPIFELRLKALFNITGRLRAEGYAAKGFTDGTPDYALGAGISYQF